MTTNILQQVRTYNDSGLALLQNSFAFISNANKKFLGFNDSQPKNLGDTVNFTKPTRFTTTNSLVASFQGVEQRVQSLTVDQQISTSYEFTAQQFIFNAREYMKEFGAGAIAEIGTKIEKNVGEVAETDTFRFYGDGVTPINSYLQLAQALAFFRNFGAAKNDTVGYLSDITFPLIINSGLNQFTPKRGDRESMSWEIGEFSNCQWYQSNLLTTHTAGTEGNAGSTLTVVSTTLDSDGAVTAITFSGTSSATDADSVKAYDKFQFSDGVAGKTNLRFLTFVGHEVSQCPVQFRATADAAAATSQVTVSVYPPLQAASGRNQNINTAIVAGMQCTVLPDHRCGLIYSGDALFLAMPRLPDESPFATANQMDSESGCSLRMYYGSLFGQNRRGMIHDAIWGKTLVSEYSLMIALPV